MTPSQLRFSYGIKGKPALANAANGNRIQFNVSHSQALALYAFVQEQEIGIDIEYIRPIPEVDQIVEHSFSSQEKELFRTLPFSEKTEAFFSGWTRKEAYLKACGDGLTYPLNLIEVSLAPGKPARVLSICGDAQKATCWFIQDLESVPGYKAALAIEGRDWHIKQWYCSEP